MEKSLLGGEVGGEGDDDVGEVGEARLGMLCLPLHLTGMSLEKTKSTEHSTCSQEFFSIAALHVVVINETQKTKKSLFAEQLLHGTCTYTLFKSLEEQCG